MLFMTLQTLCVKKVASLIAMEVECGAVPGILDALPLLPNEAAAKILALVVRTGHVTPLVVRNLIRRDQISLDLSGAAQPLCEEDNGVVGLPLSTLLPQLLRPCCASLRHLDLSDACMLVDDLSVREIIGGTHFEMRLEILHLSGISVSNETIGIGLVANAKTLKILNLSGCMNLTDGALISLSRGGEASAQGIAIEEISLSHIDAISSEGLRYLAGDDTGIEGGDLVASETKTWKSLRVLNLKGCRRVDDLPESCYFPNLEKLNATGLGRITGEAWLRFFQRYGENDGSSCNEGAHKTKKLPFIQLKLGECHIDRRTVDQILSLGSCCTDKDSADTSITLEKLDLSWVESLSGASSDAIALAVASGSCLTSLKLRCVELDSNEGTDHHSHSNYEADGRHGPLESLAANCSRLQKLNLSRCGDTIASAAALRALASGCELLTNLDLSWTNVDDAGLAAILGFSPSTSDRGNDVWERTRNSHLQILALQGCKALTTAILPLVVTASGGDHIIEGIGDKEPRIESSTSVTGELRWLDLSWVNAMDEAVVIEMVRKSAYLAVVDYYGEVQKGRLSKLYYKKCC